MRDWCIENDFAAQKEQADTLEHVILNLRGDFKAMQGEYFEYKHAMEFAMGRERCLEILSDYKEFLESREPLDN